MKMVEPTNDDNEEYYCPGGKIELLEVGVGKPCSKVKMGRGNLFEMLGLHDNWKFEVTHSILSKNVFYLHEASARLSLMPVKNLKSSVYRKYNKKINDSFLQSYQKCLPCEFFENSFEKSFEREVIEETRKTSKRKSRKPLKKISTYAENNYLFIVMKGPYLHSKKNKGLDYGVTKNKCRLHNYISKARNILGVLPVQNNSLEYNHNDSRDLISVSAKRNDKRKASRVKRIFQSKFTNAVKVCLCIVEPIQLVRRKLKQEESTLEVSADNPSASMRKDVASSYHYVYLPNHEGICFNENDYIFNLKVEKNYQDVTNSDVQPLPTTFREDTQLDPNIKDLPQVKKVIDESFGRRSSPAYPQSPKAISCKPSKKDPKKKLPKTAKHYLNKSKEVKERCMDPLWEVSSDDNIDADNEHFSSTFTSEDIGMNKLPADEIDGPLSSSLIVRGEKGKSDPKLNIARIYGCEESENFFKEDSEADIEPRTYKMSFSIDKDPEDCRPVMASVDQSNNETPKQCTPSRVTVQTMELSKSPEYPYKNELPKTVTYLGELNNVHIYLLGTAHFSNESRKDVRKVMDKLKPQELIVELCPSRSALVTTSEEDLLLEAVNIDTKRVVNMTKSDGLKGFLHAMLLLVTKHVTEKRGMPPGGEFREAFAKAGEHGIRAVFGDRSIDITLARALHSLSFWQILKILHYVLTCDDDIDEDTVENMKNKDVIEKLVEEFTEEFPSIYHTMIAERDAHLAYELQQSAYRQSLGNSSNRIVLAVVGIGHSEGIKKRFGNVSTKEFEELLIKPVPRKRWIIAKKGIKYSFYALAFYGVYKMTPNSVKDFTKNSLNQLFIAATNLIQNSKRMVSTE